MHTANITQPVLDSLDNNVFMDIDTLHGKVHFSSFPGCSRWIKFTVPADTLLRFTIEPLDGNTDLDFILFRYNGPDFCRTMSQARLKHLRYCLSSPGVDITTGLSYRSEVEASNPGMGSAHLRPVEAKKGDVFYLLVQFHIEPGLKGYDRAPDDKRFILCFFNACEPEKITLRNLRFETGKATLDESSALTLDSTLNILREKDYPAISIVGHTDNTGNEQANKELSQKRAKAVYDYFVSKGYPSLRLRYSGEGSRQPVSFNDTEEGRRMNRRVEIELVNINSAITDER
jgi:outer membrane protein OmpA-like peptidoglycan-associated protein